MVAVGPPRREREHQAAAARGAELLWGNTDIKTSKNLVEPMKYEERMKCHFKKGPNKNA